MLYSRNNYFSQSKGNNGVILPIINKKPLYKIGDRAQRKEQSTVNLNTKLMNITMSNPGTTKNSMAAIFFPRTEDSFTDEDDL
jgi:hypothetical protein